jgi:hypothetical protein
MRRCKRTRRCVVVLVRRIHAPELLYVPALQREPLYLCALNTHATIKIVSWYAGWRTPGGIWTLRTPPARPPRSLLPPGVQSGTAPGTRPCGAVVHSRSRWSLARARPPAQPPRPTSPRLQARGLRRSRMQLAAAACSPLRTLRTQRLPAAEAAPGRRSAPIKCSPQLRRCRAMSPSSSPRIA